MDPIPEPEIPPADLLARLDALVQRMFDSASGVLPARIGVTVRKSPGGLTVVEYTGSLGESLGKGAAAEVFKYGSSPEVVAAAVIETAGDRDIARRIRTEKLHELAKELGYSLKAEPKKAHK